MAMKPPGKYLSRISKQEFLSFLRDKSEHEISFSEKTFSYCVGFVDIVNSTAITAKLTNAKMCEYYSIFLNAMSKIAKVHDAIIIKNLGDSLLYYFPRTEDAIETDSFVDVLECGLDMIEYRDMVNIVMAEHSLPSLDFRVSVDYGPVSIATTPISQTLDIFGPTVNLCSKINGSASPNSMVIGGDMHQIVRSFKQYHFGVVGQCVMGLKLKYPTYVVCSK
jgi:adenylate cyclase